MNIHKILYLLVGMIFLLLMPIHSFSMNNSQKDSIIVKKGKNFKISPIAAPAYTPELGFLLAAGGLTSFKTNADDEKIQRSSIPFTIAYTSTKAIVANAILSSYWLEDKLRIYGDFWYKDMPDNYWGVGYDKGANIPKSDSTTAYNRKWWWFNPRILYQYKPSYFLGINIDYNYTQGSDASAGVANDSTYKQFNDKPMNSGFGIILRYDSRDIPVDAREGMYFDFRASFYDQSFGGDNNYQLYQFDYRQFQTLSREGITLAWQAKARFAVGDVPYGEMSQLGTPFDLRGYTWGRYRDKYMIFFIAEYRYTFLKSNEKLSKHGVVAWIATGTIFHKQQVEDNHLNWLPNIGIGYRYELQPRMNIRLDIGLGRETSGIYFNFNQAF